MAKSNRPVPATVLPSEHEQHDAQSPSAEAPEVKVETPAVETTPEPHDEPPTGAATSVAVSPEPESDVVPAPKPLTMAEKFAAASLAPPAPKGPIRSVELIVPIAPSTGYTPTSIGITLTGTQARTLADVAQGLRNAGVRVTHTADALKLLLDKIHDEAK